MMLPSRLGLGIGGLGVAGIMLSTAALAAEGMSAGTTSEAAPDLVELALAYEHGEGVPTDQLKAAALYCEAARRGDAEAQYSLGWMYANGRGVARDDGVVASLVAFATEAWRAAAGDCAGAGLYGRPAARACGHRRRVEFRPEGALA